MAVKKFVIEFDCEGVVNVSRLQVWEALKDYFIDGLYFQVEEVSPTMRAIDPPSALRPRSSTGTISNPMPENVSIDSAGN